MSTGRSFTLDAWVCGQHDDETQTTAVIRYEPANPWSVRFVFKRGACTVVRHISRDMLCEGFVAGIYASYDRENTIVVRPDSNDLMVEFVIPTITDPDQPDMRERLYVRVAKVELSLVLEEILKMVPPGDEATKFDWVAGMEHCQADAA
jgi:hypothetical protein